MTARDRHLYAHHAKHGGGVYILLAGLQKLWQQLQGDGHEPAPAAYWPADLLQ